MSDKRISDLTTATVLSPTAIIPVAQIDPADNILKNFGVAASLFSHGAYPFLNDTTTPVTSADIGLLAMNDGSGTAKVYTLSAGAASMPGEWQIDLSSGWTAAGNGYSININGQNGNYLSIDQTSWRNGAIPADANAELLLIQASINSSSLTGLSVSVVGDLLTIQEGTPAMPVYQGYVISAQNFPANAFTVKQQSLPGWPDAATAFPLGKIVGLSGSDVLISSGYIETYTMDPATTMDNTLLNVSEYQTLDFNDPTTQINIGKALAVPRNGGTVAAFDLSQYPVRDGNFDYAFHDQILGLIIQTSGSTVTVMHLNAASPILNIVLKGIWSRDN